MPLGPKDTVCYTCKHIQYRLLQDCSIAMGKFAEQFAHRNDPLNQKARELVRLVSRYIGDESDELEDTVLTTIEQYLETLSRSEMNEVMRHVYTEGAARENGEAVLTTTQAVLHGLCESPGVFQEETEEGQLLAIPLLVSATHSAWTLSIDALTADKLVTLFKEKGLIVEDASVVLAPRMLVPGEAQALFPSDVYQCAKALRDKNLPLVAQVFEDNRERLGLDFTDPAQHSGGSSLGVLMAWVATNDIEPFPLAMHFEHTRAELLGLNEDGEPEEVSPDEVVLRSAQLEELVADTGEVLQDIGNGVAPCLGADFANIPFVTSSWYEDLDKVLVLERKYAAVSAFKTLADAFTAGDMGQLCIARDFSPEDGIEGYTLRIHDSKSGQFLGTHDWMALDSETSESCLSGLGDFLQTTVSAVYDPDKGALQAIAEPRVLH